MRNHIHFNYSEKSNWPKSLLTKSIKMNKILESDVTFNKTQFILSYFPTHFPTIAISCDLFIGFIPLFFTWNFDQKRGQSSFSQILLSMHFHLYIRIIYFCYNKLRKNMSFVWKIHWYHNSKQRNSQGVALFQVCLK